MTSVFTRRNVLIGGAAAVAGAAGAGLVLRPRGGRKPLSRQGPAKKVIVVGAGPSGLATAYELGLVGHDVTVLEARERPGGRVYTLREPFSGEMYAEVGAGRIHSRQHLTLGYAEHLNLALDPVYPNEGAFVRMSGGVRRTIPWEEYSPAIQEEVGDPVLGPDRTQWSRIRGGMDMLPRALADRLGDRVLYESPVVGIEQDADQVRVTYSRGGELQTLTGDRVVCAVPFSLLREIDVAPSFSAATQAKINEMRYASIVRVFLQVKTRPWFEQGLNGFAITDDPMEVWNPSYGREKPRGILLAYVRKDYAPRLAAMTNDERIEHMLGKMETLFPGVRSQFELGASHSWLDDPWSRGSWAERPISEGIPPEGRVHFAGDQLTSYSGWIQGAFESAERAANEVNLA